MTAIVGTGMTRFGKSPGRSLRSLAAEAVDNALRDASVTAADIDLVTFANAAAGTLTGQEMVRGQMALTDTPLAGVPVINVENACASSSTAFHVAAMAVASRQAEVAIAVGAEQMAVSDRTRVDVALAGAVDVERLVEDRGPDVLQLGAGALFMEIYAREAAAYMASSDATVEDFAAAAAKNRFHGSLNPRAQQQRSVTSDEVLASRVVVAPLHLLMCSPIGDGAAAVVVASEAWARRHGRPYVRLRASVMASGQTGSNDVVRRAAARAYDQAGVGPDDLHVIELHDAASPAELAVLEDLGVAPPGDAVKLLRSGATRLGGRVPVNPSGGLVSKGHPIGATGCAQLVELSEQLLGRCGPRQVPGAQIALAENAGGWMGGGPAAAVITILERA